MIFSVPLTFTSCISFLLAVLAAAGAAVAQWNTVSHPATSSKHTIRRRTFTLQYLKATCPLHFELLTVKQEGTASITQVLSRG